MLRDMINAKGKKAKITKYEDGSATVGGIKIASGGKLSDSFRKSVQGFPNKADDADNKVANQRTVQNTVNQQNLQKSARPFQLQGPDAMKNKKKLKVK